MRQRIDSELAAIAHLEREIALRYSVIGALVLNERTARGLSLREVASEAGIDHSHLSRIERGKTRASDDVLNDILGALHSLARK